MKKAKPIIAVALVTGEVERFPSTMAAGRAGFDRRAVYRCDRGGQRTHKGRRWLYLTPANKKAPVRGPKG